MQIRSIDLNLKLCRQGVFPHKAKRNMLDILSVGLASAGFDRSSTSVDVAR